VPTIDSTSGVIRFAAVGDILLAPPDTARYPRSAELVSAELRERFAGCDIVFGNLECTLAGDGRCVPSEPRVMATPELVQAVERWESAS